MLNFIEHFDSKSLQNITLNPMHKLYKEDGDCWNFKVYNKLYHKLYEKLFS